MAKHFPNLNEGVEDYGVKRSEFYKFQEGENKIRILSVSQSPIATHFFGPTTKPVVCVGISRGCKYHGENAPKDKEGNEKTPGLKYLAYILDRREPDKIQQADLAASVFGQLNKLRGTDESGDWYFESFPMPYDLNITLNADEAPAKKYMVAPGKNETPVPEDILEQLEGMRDLDELVEARKSKSTNAV